MIGDGPDSETAWNLLDGPDAIHERIKWRYYCGAVLVGVGHGAMFFGQKRFFQMDKGHRLYPRSVPEPPASRRKRARGRLVAALCAAVAGRRAARMPRGPGRSAAPLAAAASDVTRPASAEVRVRVGI